MGEVQDDHSFMFRILNSCLTFQEIKEYKMTEYFLQVSRGLCFNCEVVSLVMLAG